MSIFDRIQFFVFLTKRFYCRIEELGKLNYALDIALQKEREGRRQMQANLRLGEVNYNVNPATPSRQSATPSPE